MRQAPISVVFEERNGQGADFRILAHDTLPSTSDEAKSLAIAGAEAGTVVWALEQTKGRGRLDRSWISNPGNLFMSVILRPDVAPARAAELAFVMALAVADTVADFVAVPVTLKWPNDVLADDGKICGILLEAQSAASGLVDWVVAGIGINVVGAPTDTPYKTSCLHGLDQRRPDAHMVLERLLAAISRRVSQWATLGFGPIRADWRTRARGIGQAIEVRQGTATVAGRFVDIDDAGALVLDTASGVVRVSVGDVHFPDMRNTLQ